MAERTYVDLESLYGALNAERENRVLSWRDLARQAGTSPSTFTRLAQGRGTDAETFARLVAWLGVSADAFLRKAPVSRGQPPRTVAAISSFLRADRSLLPEETAALEKIMASAYKALRAARNQ
jgi:transcriptional regulator with XRE-family HTH domain